MKWTSSPCVSPNRKSLVDLMNMKILNDTSLRLRLIIFVIGVTFAALNGWAGNVASESPTELLSLQEITSLAQRYENAEGLPRDYQKAHELYCQAAKAGFADAQYAMGWMYANGRGVSKNDQTAAQLFQVAAEQGHPQATQLSAQLGSSDISALPACLTMQDVVPVEIKETPAALPYPKGKISQLVEKWAPRYSVDPGLAMAIIYVESRFNERAVSAKNAQGLMQLMPDTAERFRVKNPFDPEQNIKGGLSYLRWLLSYFRGNVSLVAAAYNAGEGSVDKYRGVPPYLETRDYVKKVAALYSQTTHPFQRSVVDASSVVMRRLALTR